MGWSDQTKQAQKILGAKAKIPAPDGEIIKASKHVDELFGELETERSTLADLLDRMDNFLSYFQGQIKKFRAVVDKDNLGLDPQNKDDAKKIEQAKAILLGWLDDQLSTGVVDIADFKELRKHLKDLYSYDGPQCGDSKTWRGGHSDGAPLNTTR